MEKTLGKMTFSASTHISESRSSRIRTHSTVAAGPPSVKEVCLTSKLESSNHFHLELLLKKARRSKVNQPPRALFILRQKNFFSFSLSLVPSTHVLCVVCCLKKRYVGSDEQLQARVLAHDT